MREREKLEQFWKWRDAERKKHRYMTAAEYAAWCRGGDAISCSTDADALHGGLTIDFSSPPIIGRTDPGRTSNS